MKTLKIFLSILLLFSFLFLGLLVHTVYYSNHGPDGFGGFFESIFYGGAFLICAIVSISLGTIFLLPNTSNMLRFIVATLVSLITAYITLALTILPAIRIW